MLAPNYGKILHKQAKKNASARDLLSRKKQGYFIKSSRSIKPKKPIEERRDNSASRVPHKTTTSLFQGGSSRRSMVSLNPDAIDDKSIENSSMQRKLESEEATTQKKVVGLKSNLLNVFDNPSPRNLKTKRNRVIKKKKKKENTSDKPKKASSKAPTESLFSSLFFISFSRLFWIAGKRNLEDSDLFQLPAQNSCNSIIREFDGIHLIYGPSLGKNIFRILKNDLIIATILKVTERALEVSIPFLMSAFIQELRNEHLQYEWLILYTVTTPPMTFLVGLLSEHSAKYISRVKARTGQCLRSIFYTHVITSNIAFLKNVDTQFIAKMLIYEFEAIIEFTSNVPNFLAFPLAFFIAVTLIVMKIGVASLVLIPIFFINILILGLLDRKLLVLHSEYKKIGSKRILVLTDMFYDMIQVKINSWESSIFTQLKEIRSKEMKILNIMSFVRGLNNSIVFLTPLLCAVLVILLRYIYCEEKISVEVTFALVSVLITLQKPLKILSSYVDLYLQFKIGHISLSTFFRSIIQRPVSMEIKSWITDGEIKIFNCTACLEDDMEMHKIIGDIFNIMNQNEETSKAQIQHSNQSRKKEHRRLPNQNAEEENLEDDRVGKERGRSPSTRRMKFKRNTLNTTTVTNLYQILSGKNKFKIETSPESKKKNQRKKSKNLDKVMIHMDCTLYIKPRSKVCLMGRENSGSRGVLLTIMEETFIIQGTADIRGSYCYLSLKEVFFYEGKTLRENIILNEECFDRERYEEVLQICRMSIKHFFKGDSIIILENGRNLSSGEREKILLARFLYCDRDIYLIDDFFDEMDCVGTNYDLFEAVVFEFLADKTVVFTSRKEEFVCKADIIHVFDSKTIVDSGTYDDLMQSPKRYFCDLLISNIWKQASRRKRLKSVHKNNLLMKKMSLLSDDLDSSTKQGIYQLINSKRTSKCTNEQDLMKKIINFIADVHRDNYIQRSGFIEDAQVNEQPYALLKQYVLHLGACRIWFVGVIFLIAVIGIVSSDVWLGIWARRSFTNLSFWAYLAIYAGISIFAGFFVIIRDLIYHKVIKKNANSLHMSLINKTFNTSLSWYRLNPTSRIIYRMTRDQKVIDENLNSNLQRLFDAYIMVFGAACIVSVTYFGIPLLVYIPILFYVRNLLRRYFLVANFLTQKMAEKKGNLQSIFLNVMKDTLHLRKLHLLDVVQERFFEASDSFQKYASHLFFIAPRWLNMRLLGVRVMLVFFSFLFPLVYRALLPSMSSDQIWKFALAISWSLKMVDYVGLLIDVYINIAQESLSVGRIFSFINHEHEEDKYNERKTKLSEKKVLLAQFPIIFDRVFLSYGKKLVLKDITFTIKAGSRVCIIGDTAAGKHSIMNLAMRLYNKSSGSIQIFGRDIDSLRIKDIRHRSFYISDKSALLNGKVKSNIDPDGLASQNQLIRILVYFGFLNLLKLNTATLDEFEEWKMIEEDSDSKFNMIINLLDFLSKEKKESSVIRIKQNLQKNSNFALFNRLYEALVSDMLIKKNRCFAEQINSETGEVKTVANRSSARKVSRRRSSINFTRRKSLEKKEEEQREGEEEEVDQKSSIRPIMSSTFIASPINVKNKSKTSSKHDLKIQELDLDNLFLNSRDNDIKSIKSFLHLKVIGTGHNIPTNMHKMVMLAKAYVSQPHLLFIDDNSLDFGYEGSWTDNITKIKRAFDKSTVIALLTDFTHIVHFDEIIFIENGKIIEQGNVEDLLLNKSSLLRDKVMHLHKHFYNEYMEALHLKHLDEEIIYGVRQQYNISHFTAYNTSKISEEDSMSNSNTSQLNNNNEKIESEVHGVSNRVMNPRLTVRENSSNSKDYPYPIPSLRTRWNNNDKSEAVNISVSKIDVFDKL